MLTATLPHEDLVTTAHRAKLAFIYVRQSSVGQVRQHQESTELQYRLVDRALHLGWPRERVQVIDEDLGCSGASSDGRQGFQKLIAEIGLGHAGLVLSLDASRLARNNRDWYQLIELCGLFGVLIADGERLFDPAAYHDRLLLGLSGIMSEAELHQIKIRLHQGERQKAERGELRQPLPAGLAEDRGGMIVLNPDEEVQARLNLVFHLFRDLGSAHAVMRALQRAGLLVPVRPLRGPAPHAVVWQPADSSRVLNILKNPSYAGAYVYGRHFQDPGRRRAGVPRSGTVTRPPDAWPVCLLEAHPGYIGWEEFMANQKRLSDNINRYSAGHRGVPRKGMALLQGIAVCGRCGRRMGLGYSGPHGEYPVYRCGADKHQSGAPMCQEVRALAVDAEIERLVLEALTPDRVALAIAALSTLDEEARLLERQWALRRERARYEAERARRQYDAVEPENRLVARSLERAWEERLRAVEQVETEYEHWYREQPLALSDAERTEILAVGANLSAVWHAQTTTAADRKRIVRLIIQEAILDQKQVPGRVLIRLVWQTGAVSEHDLRRTVHSYDCYAEIEELEGRVRALNAAGKMDGEIAETLNAEGFLSSRGTTFDHGLVFLLRKRWGIATVKINGAEANPVRWPDGSYSIQGAAKVLGVTAQTILKWLKCGRLSGHQLAKGLPWQIMLEEERIPELRTLVRRTTPSRRKAL
ncbi:Site-specific DNA recombinase [Azospirillum oryzae]|uniref:Site-specific DNA recombinase n=1 Tax=Azospirillum oryzae TaxID=286727 RepID=A0A1X7EMF4_9PROT|nr:recombinase family protein [Azospirillum oryzae]SMF36612.1 Site-specific DNA recombinase [Azospirillum oryzae]